MAFVSAAGWHRLADQAGELLSAAIGQGLQEDFGAPSRIGLTAPGLRHIGEFA